MNHVRSAQTHACTRAPAQASSIDVAVDYPLKPRPGGASSALQSVPTLRPSISVRPHSALKAGPRYQICPFDVGIDLHRPSGAVTPSQRHEAAHKITSREPLRGKHAAVTHRHEEQIEELSRTHRELPNPIPRHYEPCGEASTLPAPLVSVVMQGGGEKSLGVAVATAATAPGPNPLRTQLCPKARRAQGGDPVQRGLQCPLRHTTAPPRKRARSWPPPAVTGGSDCSNSLCTLGSARPNFSTFAQGSGLSASTTSDTRPPPCSWSKASISSSSRNSSATPTSASPPASTPTSDSASNAKPSTPSTTYSARAATTEKTRPPRQASADVAVTVAVKRPGAPTKHSPGGGSHFIRRPEFR